MSWIFDHLGFLIFLAIAFSVVQKIRGFLKRVEGETERRTRERASPAALVDTDEAARVRQIQEEIRRKIAERRSGLAPAMPVPEPPPLYTPPVIRPAPVAPLDPFGGPMGKVLAELQRRAQAAAQPQPPPVAKPAPAPNPFLAEVEAPHELVDQMRALQETRATQTRTTQAAAAAHTVTQTAARAEAVSGVNVLANLRDPRSLRRAIVLREVLGEPVGLR